MTHGRSARRLLFGIVFMQDACVQHGLHLVGCNRWGRTAVVGGEASWVMGTAGSAEPGCRYGTNCIYGADFGHCVNVIRPCDKVAQIPALGGGIALEKQKADIL